MSQPFQFESFPTLETERLLLRQLTPADDAAVLRFRGDPEVQKYNAPPFTTIYEARDLIHWLNRQFADHSTIAWGVTLKGVDVVIGLCGYNYWDQYHQRASVGYDLAQTYWGQGIMPEALQAVVKFGFERMNLNRIEAEVAAVNQASLRVMAKLGFRQEGILSGHYFDNGKFHDDIVFAFLRANYEKSPEP